MKTRTARRTQKTSSARKTGRKATRSSSQPRPSRKAAAAARSRSGNVARKRPSRRPAAAAPSTPLLLVHEGQVVGRLELTEPQVDQLCQQAERLLISPEEWAAWLLATACSPGPVNGALPPVPPELVETGEPGPEAFCVPVHPRVAQFLVAEEDQESRDIFLRSQRYDLSQFLTPLMTWRLIEAHRSLEIPPELEAYALDQLRGLHELLEPEEQRALEELAVHELKEWEAYEEEEAEAELEQLVKAKRLVEASQEDSAAEDPGPPTGEPPGEPASAPVSAVKPETVYTPEVAREQLLHAASAIANLLELLDGVTGGLVTRSPELIRQVGEGSGEGEGPAYQPAA